LGEWEYEYRPGGMAQIKRQMKLEFKGNLPEEMMSEYEPMRRRFDGQLKSVFMRIAVSAVLVLYITSLSGIPERVNTFVNHCHMIARQLANPKVVFMSQSQSGKPFIVDDYYKGYKWIDANTPKDARVIAWWDYGYQITGIAKRTSIADGNTWNHEHIATLGRTLTSPEKKAWNAIRHIADYLLVWAGGRGDDLAKSPHLARIGNSVFPDHCGDEDPKCTKFSFYSDGSPMPMMRDSLLYNAVQHNMKPKIKLNPKYFKEVHTTKHGLMRVFQVMNISEESKQWVADPANRVCDAPGSWYCVGQYPPPLHKLIAKRRSFAQVGDFNSKDGAKSAYTKMIEKERDGKSSDL
jgi:dolichyl-diphosphooligosaccharide--protein glycosyltransferase